MRSCAALCFLLIALATVASGQDTIQVKTGWNIIGSVKAGAAPEVLSTVPDSIITTAFFGYNPGTGYESTDTLGKGLGYWVKVSADGIVIFEASPYTGCGVKRVEHGGISYGTVLIGSQCWLSENLNLGTMIDSQTNQANNAATEKYCYENDSVNCVLYGGLYQWDEAMQYVTTPGAQGICPTGWHIPTLAEFQTLESAVSGDGNALKRGGVGAGSGVGTNTSGFSALLAGARPFPNGGFSDLGYATFFWSSTEIDGGIANYLLLNGSDGGVHLYDTPGDRGFSVRCLED